MKSPQKSSPVIVYYWGCFMHGGTGAHVRVRQQLDWLVARGFDVAFYSYEDGLKPGAAASSDDAWTEANQAKFREAYPRVRLVLETPSRALKLMTWIKRRAIMLGLSNCQGVLGFVLPGAAPELTKLYRLYPDATVLVNYVEGAIQIGRLPAGQTVIETHDLQFVKRRKLNKARAASLSSMLRMRFELSVIDAVRHAIAITRNEATVLETLVGDDKVLAVPSYMRPDDVALPTAASGPFTYDLAFVGSDNPFNVAGFRAFVEANSKWLSRYSIALCGKVCGVPEIQALVERNPNITSLGFVEDLAGLYNQSKAVLSPIDGTGLKIKAVEALMHGKPVFASEHTMMGLAPGYDACVFQLDRERIERLLADDKEREAAEAAIREYLRLFFRESEQDKLFEALQGREGLPPAGENLADCSAGVAGLGLHG
ncbi:MAG: glycosyltransferase [Pseudomonadota bacterium]